jgi:ABC-type Fe3+ transport system substrate-binding protein
VRQWEQTKGRTVGIYSGALGFGFNVDLVKKKGFGEPKCWADLLDAKLKDEVQVADPNSSGTAYTLLATMIRSWGGLFVSQGAPQEMSINTQIRCGSGASDGDRRGWSASHSSTIVTSTWLALP